MTPRRQSWISRAVTKLPRSSQPLRPYLVDSPLRKGPHYAVVQKAKDIRVIIVAERRVHQSHPCLSVVTGRDYDFMKA